MYIRYPHIERFGKDEVDGILDGECYVFPKIDGTNAVVWYDAGLRAGSRNRELSLDRDNAGFFKWVTENAELFIPFFEEHPKLYLYGEWLVPHTLKTYRDSAWRNFYIFDVWHSVRNTWLTYDQYSQILDKLIYIPPLEKVLTPTADYLVKLLNRNTYLIEDGCGVGEGIVIKNYEYVNKFGNTVWAKLVRNEFKENNKRVFGTNEVTNSNFEYSLAVEFVTRGRVEKILAKMLDTGALESKRIPEFLNRVWYDIVTEELWEINKKYKNPIINFKSFNRFVIAEAKRNCPEFFGV